MAGSNTQNLDTLMPDAALKQVEELTKNVKENKAAFSELLSQTDSVITSLGNVNIEYRTLSKTIEEFNKLSGKKAQLDKKHKDDTEKLAKAQKELSEAQSIQKKQLEEVQKLQNERAAKIAHENEMIGNQTTQVNKVSLSYSDLSRRLNEMKGTDVLDYMESVHQGVISNATAAQHLSQEFARITSLMGDYEEALLTSTVTNEQYDKAMADLNTRHRETFDSLQELRGEMANANEDNSEMAKVNKMAVEAWAMLSEEMQRGGIALTELNTKQVAVKDAIKQLDKDFKDGAISANQYAESKARLTNLEKANAAEIKKSKKELELSIQVANTAIGSYDNLSAQYSLMKIRINAMGEASKEDVKQKREMEKQSERLYDRMNQLQQATGKHQLSVGNYKIATEDLNKTLSLLSPTFGRATVATQAFGKQLLVLLANPIVATIAAIAAVIMILVAVFTKVINVAKSNEEQAHKLNQAMMPLRVIADALTRKFEKLAETFIKVASAVSKAIVKFMDWIGVTENMEETVEKYADLEKRRLDLAIKTRKYNEENAKAETEIAELRADAADKEKYTVTQRMKFLKDASDKENEITKKKIELATEAAAILKEQADLSGTKASTQLLDELSEANVKVENLNKEAAEKNRTLLRSRSAAYKEMVSETQQALRKELEYRREIQEATLKAMKDSVEKERALLELSYQKRIDDAKLRGVNEIELVKQIELEKQKALEEFDYNSKKKISETNLQNALSYVKKGSTAELSLRLDSLNLQEEEELRVAEKIGADKFIIQQKYNKLREDAVNDSIKTIEDIEMGSFEQYRTAQQAAMNEELSFLAGRYKAGIMSREEYEKEKEGIGLKYAQSALEQELEIAEKFAALLTGDDRIAAEKRIAEIRMELSQMATDKNIADAEREAEARKKVMADLYSSTTQLMSTILDSYSQKNIKKLEKEAEENQAWRDEELKRIEQAEDAGAISKEQADARKAQVDAQAQLRQDQIDKKKRDALIKQAKAEKAMAIANIAINTAMAIMKNTALMGLPLSAPLNILTAILGAVQAAAVLATPIPAYKDGTDNHPGGLAIVGDGGKKELIVTPSGQMIVTPTTDTLIDLPKGTQVIPDYNAAIERIMMRDKVPNDYQVMPVIIHDNAEQIRKLDQSNRLLMSANVGIQKIRANRMYLNGIRSSIYNNSLRK